MNAHRFHPRSISIGILGVFLLIISGATGLFAQVSAPLPSHGQVIAQGIMDLDAGDYFWSMEPGNAGPQEPMSSPAMAAGEFIYASVDPVMVHRDYQDFSLLSQGQATWARATVPTQILATGDTTVEFMTISLESGRAVSATDQAEIFSLEEGAYNLQLTRGVLAPGEADTFSPVNDLPWLLVSGEGEVSVNGLSLEAGEAIPVEGDAEIRVSGSTPATYLAVSVGDQVELPSDPSAGSGGTDKTGTLKVSQLECATSDFATCEPAADEFDVMLTHGETGEVTFLSLNGTWISKGEYDLELLPGTYFVDIPQPGTWTYEYASYVDVVAASEVSLQITRGPNEMVGTLIVTLVECPYYGASDCTYGAWAWDVWLTNADSGDSYSLMGVGYAYAEGQWELTLPAGSYFVSVGSTDAYQYEYTNIVDVPALGTANLQVNREPVEATGIVIITLLDCTTTDGSMCPLANMLWNVFLTNVDTGEEFVMSEIGYSSVPGQWYMDVPAGGYTVFAMADGPWSLEFTSWIDVPANGSAFVEVYGYPYTQHIPIGIRTFA